MSYEMLASIVFVLCFCAYYGFKFLNKFHNIFALLLCVIISIIIASLNFYLFAEYISFIESSATITFQISLLCALIFLSFIDCKLLAVPSFSLVWLIIFATFCALTREDFEIFKPIFALALIGFLFLLKFMLETFLKKVVLGDADIIILGCCGAIFDIIQALIALFFASLIALIFFIYLWIFKKLKPLPFLPFLSAGLFFNTIFFKNFVFL